MDFHLRHIILYSKDKWKIATSVLRCLKLNNVEMKYVDKFKYLGHCNHG